MCYKKVSEPIFTRSDVAQILNVSPLTVANREKTKKYPVPKRDLNNSLFFKAILRKSIDIGVS